MKFYEEEKKAAEERAAAVEASGKKKESGKSSVLLDVKPWDDETDMQKFEEAVRSVQMEGLFWGASKLVPVSYGIRKLQIMMTIVDDLVSVDNLIQDHLTSEPANVYIQSCDIVAFNKIYSTNYKEMGRKKIGISQIENKASRLATFTKRRKDLFKKAYELGTLCGTNVAILGFSPAGIPFAFGHPSVDPVINRYCDYYSHGGRDPDPTPMPASNSHGGHDPDPTPMPSSNLHLDTVSMQPEQQIQTHLHDQCSHGSWSRKCFDGEGYWWDRVNIDDYVELSELEKLKESLERLRDNVWSRVEELSRDSFVQTVSSAKFEGNDVAAGVHLPRACKEVEEGGYGAGAGHPVAPHEGFVLGKSAFVSDDGTYISSNQEASS